MIKQNKVWGETSELFFGNNVEVHRIKINKGGYCSKHYHLHKYNMFFVESGYLQIEVFRADIIDKTNIGKGEQTTVLPKEYHRFRAIQDTIAYEIYWTELQRDDIQREDQGGIYAVKKGK